MADGVNPLDPLGPITGSLGQPSLDPNYYETPPGIYPEIKFPDPGANRRNTFGTPGVTSNPAVKKNFSEGIRSYVKNSVASGAKTDDFANISTYDAGPDSNAFYDRYMAYGQEKFDEVGFHPFRNNEANFNANTTWTDDFSRMLKHSFVPLLKTGFVSGPKSLGKMLHGDFTGSDLDEAKEYERAAAIGQSSKDGFGAFVNNTVMNFGYTAGIVSEILAEEVALGFATVGSGGGASGLAAVRTGQNINRLGKAFTTFGKMADRTSDMIKSFNSMNAARKFWSAAGSRVGRFVNPLENTFDLAKDIRKVVKSGNQLDGLAVISKTAGSLYRDVRTINMAVSEARLEAGMVENHLRDKFYEEFYKENGRAPNKEESEALFDLAKKGSRETFYTNAGLIYLTNKITFGNITGPRGGIRNFMQSTMDDIYTAGARAGEKNFGNIGKILYDNTKKEFVFRANNLKNLAKSWYKEPGVKTLGKTIGYFKANVSEGIQENLQETIARTNERYYEQVFKDSDLLKGQLYSNGVMRMAYKDVNGIFNAPLSMYKEELSKEFSKQGFETFASGFAMGFLATPLNNAMPFLSVQYNRIFNKDAYKQWKDMKMDVTKNIVQNLNAVDINEFLNNRVVNLSTQDVISKIKRKGSYKEAYDAEVESFVRSVGTMTRTGTTDIFINKLKSYKEMTDAELIDAVNGKDINEAPMYRERVDKAIAKLEKVQKRYETASEKFVNPININSLDKSKMSAVEYNQYAALYNAWEEGVNNYVYFSEAFEDNAKRMKSIQQDYLKGSALQNVEYNSAKYMFRPQEITDDVKNLELELSLEKEKGTDADQKRVNLLEQQIADLKAYKQAYDNFRKFYNRADSTGEVETELKKELGRQPTPEEISARMDELQGDITDQVRQEEILGALKDAHHKYLRNLAQNTNSTVFEENLDDAFNKLADFYKLDDESTVLARSIDLLSNPAEFTGLVEKNMDFMRRMYNKRSEYYEQMIREQIKMIEANALLNALANQGIYVSAEEFAEYLKTGKAPTEFYDNVNKLLYTEGTEMYDRIYQSTFALMDKLQEENLNDTPMFVDEVYQQKYEELREEANRKIEALPRTFRRQNKGLVKPIKGKTMSLAEVVEQMSPNEYVELNYEGDEGVQVVYFLDDSGALRMDNVEGDVVVLEDVETKFTEGTRYIEDYLPEQKAVDEIIAEFEQQVKDLQDDYAKDKAVEIELGREERFTPISINDDVESMPEALVNKLKALYDDYLKTTMVEEDYVNMSQDEYENGFRVFVKSGTASVKELIDEYNKSKQVEAAVKEKGLKDDFTFNFNGTEINTKDLSVPNLRSYQRQINNIIKTLDENDPQYQKYQTLVTNLEKVINKRLKEGLSQEQKEAIKKIQELKNKQKPYTVDANGYRIGGSLYKRVTQEIQKLKDKKYAYKDAKKIEEIYGRTIGAEGFNEASINKFVEELKKTDLGGFFEYTYDEVKTQLQELLKGSYDTTTTTTDIEAKKADIERTLEVDGVIPEYGKFRPAIPTLTETIYDENGNKVKTKEYVGEEEVNAALARGVVGSKGTKPATTKTRTKTIKIGNKNYKADIELYPDGTAVYRISEVDAGGIPIKTFSETEYDAELAASEGTTTPVDTTAQQEELKMLQAELAAEEALVEGKSEDRIAEIKSRIKELESALPKDNLLSKIQSIVSENAYEDSRIAGNYLDNAIKVLFEDGIVPQFDERYMTREAFDSLFGPEGYLTNIRKKVDSGELYIAARDLVVFDDELMIAGEIDLLVADRKGNIFIVDLKTGEKSKWDGFKKANNPYSKLEDYTLQQTAYANLLNRMIGIDPGITLLPVQITKDPKGSGQILTAKKPTSPNVLTTDSLILLDKSLVRDKINTIIPLTKEVVNTSQTNADIFENEDRDISDDEQDNGLKDSIDNDQLEEDESTEAEKELVKELMKTIKTTRDLDSVRAEISMSILTGELSEESIDKLNEALIERAAELQNQPKDQMSADMLAEGVILVAKSNIFTKSKTTPYMTEGEEVRVSSISDDGKTIKVRKLKGRTDVEYSIKDLNDKFILKTDLYSDKTESQDDTQMDKSDQEFSKQGSDLVSEFQNSDLKITQVEENSSNQSLDQLDNNLLDDLIC